MEEDDGGEAGENVHVGLTEVGPSGARLYRAYRFAVSPGKRIETDFLQLIISKTLELCDGSSPLRTGFIGNGNLYVKSFQ